ncbi:phage head spike fiber domain-containing protein [Nocardioides soli]|uniref:CBM-cenC domain-containing protein n=1 Tax=Nocardioides soli TaxID=1036020 RepID=A0A7W4YZY7_9ACTN|nr:hypothetical protein [Nocardioides soli]MBB3040201.1 hypothetical protein [Nocardioides soli]
MKIEDIREHLRFEVEDDQEGLPNLVQNPSGELGTWAWESPVPGSFMYTGTSAGLPTISYKHAPSAIAGYFTTELMAVDAGKYVAARVDITNITAGHRIKLRPVFYNSSKTLISSGTQTNGFTTGSGQYLLPPALAPAGTAYVRLRADIYRMAGPTDTPLTPNANCFVDLKNVMVTWANTSGAISTVKTNLIPNPSVELDTATWITMGAPLGLAVGAYSGTYCLSMAGSWGNVGFYTQVPISGGKDYTFSTYLRQSTGASAGQLYLRWFTSTNTQISTKIVNINTNSTWTRFSATATAPSNATSVWVMYYTAAVTSAATYYADAMMLEEGTTPSTYFDGSKSSTAQKVYGWSGTPHASASTESSTDFAFVEPAEFRNILGSSSHLEIDTAEFSPGLGGFTLYDAALSPADADALIRPNKRVRIRVRNSFTESGLKAAEFYTLYEGRIGSPTVDYDPLKKDKGVKITIPTTNNYSVLAEQGENSVVANIADLAYTLEGKGVPWNINGSGNQVTSASVVAYNENAKMTDQIIVTRDTNLAKVWIDRNNVLQAHTGWNPPVLTAFYDSSPEIEADPVHNIAPQADGLKIDWDAADCINNVVIKWLRYDVGAARTTEVNWPSDGSGYADVASQKKWGVRTKEFKICGLPLNENNSYISSYANSILAANAQPKVRIRSLTWAVTKEEHLYTVLANDLYSNVYVSFALPDGQSVEGNHQITGIKHTISADKDKKFRWLVTYTFADTGSVATPVSTESPPFQGVGVAPGVWQNYTPSIVNMTGSVQRSRWMRVGNTITYQFRIYITSGSGSTAAISVPVPMSSTYYSIANIWGEHLGEVTILNNSTGYISSGHAYTLGHSGMIIFRPHDNSIEWPGSSLIGAYVQGYVIYEAA